MSDCNFNRGFVQMYRLDLFLSFDFQKLYFGGKPQIFPGLHWLPSHVSLNCYLNHFEKGVHQYSSFFFFKGNWDNFWDFDRFNYLLIHSKVKNKRRGNEFGTS